MPVKAFPVSLHSSRKSSGTCHVQISHHIQLQNSRLQDSLIEREHFIYHHSLLDQSDPMGRVFLLGFFYSTQKFFRRWQRNLLLKRRKRILFHVARRDMIPHRDLST